MFLLIRNDTPFKISPKESPFMNMSEEFRERCAEVGSQHKMRLSCLDAGNTLVINTLFWINTVSLARRKQDLDSSFHTVTNTHYCKF